MATLTHHLQDLTFSRWTGASGGVHFAGSDDAARQVALDLAAEKSGRSGVASFDGSQIVTTAVTHQLNLPPCGCEAPWRADFSAKPPCICCRADLAEALEGAREVLAGGDVGAVVVEAVLVGAGCAIPAPGFLRALRALCDRNDVLMIADETATGPARSGRLWAIDHTGVIPDILVFGGALSFSGVATQAAGSPVRDAHPEPTSTLPSSLTDPGVAATAERTGRRLRQRLERISSPHRGRVRGVGLLVGVAVHDDLGRTDPSLASALCSDLAAGPLPAARCGHVLVLTPSPDVTEADVDGFCDRFQDALMARSGSVS